MAIFKPSLFIIATLLTLGLQVIPAQATALRTFVSSTGNDANTASSCPATAPCRTLAAAFSVTQASGHIFMKDVAGYGSLTITRSVTLVAIDGALIGVPSGGTGITINAGVNDDVTIDGLIIDGAGVGQNGIVFNTGKSLTITKSVIRGLTNSGILFQPNATSALQVSNTVVNKNSGIGIYVSPSGSGTVTVRLSRVELYNHPTSAFLATTINSTGKLNATIDDSAVTNNGSAVSAGVANTGVVRLTLIRSVIAYNANGLATACCVGVARIGQSTLTGNGVSWSGAVFSYADNNITDNDDGDPTPTPIVKK